MVLIIIVPIFLMFSSMSKKFKIWGRMRSESAQEIIQTITHSLGGLKETRIIGCEQYFEHQIDQHGNKFARSATLSQIFITLPRIALETALITFLVGFICVSLLFFENKFQDIVSVMSVFAIATIRLLPSASQLIQGIGRLGSAGHALDMLYADLKEIEREELAQQSELPTIMQGTETLAFKDQIDLNQISYSYPNTPEPAIKHLSLSIRKGESIALIGKSGAGKTTLVDVILGFLKPERGDIQVDGVSVYQNLRAWQNLVGYIPQAIFLMDDTIERNIAFGVPDHLIDVERLRLAMQAAQLDDLIADLPHGIKTSIGERGVRLSGGQRQRIGIARALYHEREILVLDEATSALDHDTERLVSNAIHALSGSTTLIIIAHRLTTIEHCDRVYVLESGELIRSGTYEEVVLVADS